MLTFFHFRTLSKWAAISVSTNTYLFLCNMILSSNKSSTCALKVTYLRAAWGFWLVPFETGLKRVVFWIFFLFENWYPSFQFGIIYKNFHNRKPIPVFLFGAEGFLKKDWNKSNPVPLMRRRFGREWCPRCFLILIFGGKKE